jgi:predicted transport protein
MNTEKINFHKQKKVVITMTMGELQRMAKLLHDNTKVGFFGNSENSHIKTKDSIELKFRDQDLMIEIVY